MLARKRITFPDVDKGGDQSFERLDAFNRLASQANLYERKNGVSKFPAIENGAIAKNYAGFLERLCSTQRGRRSDAGLRGNFYVRGAAVDLQGAKDL